MNKTEEVIEHGGEEWWYTEPVNTIEVDSSKHTYRYTFNRVYVGDVDDEFTVPTHAEWWREDRNDVLFYQYRDRPVVMVTQNGAYTEHKTNADAKKQAYFILSKLDEYGYVGGWKKQ